MTSPVVAAVAILNDGHKSLFSTQGEDCHHHEKTLNPKRVGVDDKAKRDFKHRVLTT